MSIIQTELSIKHLELIKIFFEANDMPDAVVRQYDKQIGAFYHPMIEIYCSSEDTETNITFMAMKHMGFKNMLDDYLMKCGVDHWNLEPDSVKIQRAQEEAQIKKECEEQRDKEFNEYFNKRKQSI